MGQQHVSSRPITLEVRIPQDQAGIVIGRGGQTIKEIQSRSNTRIHFKDELATNDYRFIAVIGLPDDVKLAEIFFLKTSNALSCSVQLVFKSSFFSLALLKSFLIEVMVSLREFCSSLRRLFSWDLRSRSFSSFASCFTRSTFSSLILSSSGSSLFGDCKTSTESLESDAGGDSLASP